MVLTYRLPYFFIADAITQTNVHDNSRSVYAQIVNENGYDYNEVKADINSVFRGE
ncbi:ferredoxin [Cronobacter dublinensis subsp. dublinensis LMG 23823]|nr:ferredoxin [Cronobacter dublinensis subsp. dublinensis LMG 23823]